MPNQPFELLTIDSYKAYFENLVARASFLDTFYYTYAEVTNAGKVDRGGTMLVLEPYSNNIAENQNDNTLGSRRGMFVVAKASKAILDIPSIQSECEVFCYKIIGQIKRDSREYKLRTQINGWEGYEIAPVTSARYVGYAIEFTFESPINRFMVDEPGDWVESGFPYTLPITLL